jgi:hypothetical protein
VLWAAVPEAAIHKDSDLDGGKDEVRLAEYGLMTPPADNVVATQQVHQGEFRFLVAVPANPGHHFGAFRFREDVRHDAT